MTCSTCARWIVGRVTNYADGSQVETYRSPEGKGHCEILDIDTIPDFGCTCYQEGADPVRVTLKPGAPWQFWEMIPCPSCIAKGETPEGARCQCAGTGQVRRYDDGFIGDERTRVHPTEKALGLAPKPHCQTCSREVEIMWVACPFCGGRLEPPARTEVVSDPMGGTNASPEAMARAAAERHAAGASEADTQ